MLFDIEYNHGVMNPITVEAENEDMARRLGLAAYRKNSTLMDNFDAKFIVKSVTPSNKPGYQMVV